MKKRFLLPLLLFFLPATIISAAYAGFVYSNKVDTKTDSNSGKIDDVKPNFKLDENNYTIYFFPSMQAAQISFSSTDESLIANEIDNSDIHENDQWKGIWPNKKVVKPAWGYWQNATDNVIIGGSNANNKKKYYPKKIETHGGPSISLKQFNSIGEPSTNGQDDREFPLYFSGWTAIKKTAEDKYRGQGEYDYISAFDDLTKIDNDISDGTKAGDKVIFVYPIFTSGKDYDNPKNAVSLLASRSDPNDSTKEITKPRYLSRVDGAENTTYFYYKNLVINENEPWSWALNFAGLKNKNNWYSSWPYYRNGNKSKPWENPSYYIYKKGFNNSLIVEPGIYNVYAYLQRGKGNFDLGKANGSKFSTDINSNLIPLIYEDDYLNFSNNDGFEVSLSDLTTSYKFWLFVKIEKVYEFRLAGTEGRGFTFDTAGQLYVSRFSSSDYSGPQLGSKLWKIYYLDNVFLEKGKNNLFTEYTNPSDITKKYKIRNTVFSFLPSDENLATIKGIQQMTPEELIYVNENELDLNVKGNYKGISDTSFKKIENSQDEYIKHHENLPNYVPGKDYADYFFASEFKYSGFCKVLIKVDFETSGDNKGKPISIRVAVAPYLTNIHKVYVYPNGTDLVSFIDPNTKLIDPENNTTLKAIELTSFEMKTNDDYILNDQEITLKDGSKMMLSAYLTQYDVVDHLTNKKIEIGKSYKRHMACWQRVKTS